MTPRDHAVELATGLRYHYLAWGEPAATRRIVLVHGFLDSAWTWYRVAPILAESLGCLVIAPDLRGHGESQWIGPGGYYHFLDYVADMASFGTSLGLASFDLIGHSMGGSVATYLAALQPSSIRSLVLIEGMGPAETVQTMPERLQIWLADWHAARSQAPRSMSLAAAAARIANHDPLCPVTEAAFIAEKLTQPAAPPAPADHVRFRHDPLHLTRGPYPYRVDAAAQCWAAITAPTLVIDGALSDFSTSAAERATRRAHLRHATHLELPGAGHMAQRHQPDALANAITAFLR